MSRPDLHLGTIHAVNTESGLALDLTTSIELSPTHFPDWPVSGLGPLDLITSREVWVTRAKGCRIVIQLLVDDGQPRDEQWLSNTVEALGQALRGAELWEQLSLQVSLSIPHPGHSLAFDQEDIILKIGEPGGAATHCGNATSVERASRSLGYVKPPVAVPSVGIQTIWMKLNLVSPYDFFPPLKRIKKANDYEEAQRVTSEPDLQEGPFHNHMTLGHLESVEEFTQTLSSHRSLRRRNSDPASSHGLGWPSDEDHSSVHSGALEPEGISIHHRSRDAVQRLVASQPSPEEYSTSKRPHPNSFLIDGSSNDAVHEASLRSIVELTDAALRSSISFRSGSVVGNPKVKVTKDSPGPSLSAIAPSLWSPGYLSSISQRAPHVTTVSRSLRSISQRCKSPSLRQSLCRLSQFAPSGAIHARDTLEAGLQNGPSDLYAVAQARLWRLLQQRLYDPAAALALKPLQMVAEDARERDMSVDSRSQSLKQQTPEVGDSSANLSGNEYPWRALTAKNSVLGGLEPCSQVPAISAAIKDEEYGYVSSSLYENSSSIISSVEPLNFCKQSCTSHDVSDVNDASDMEVIKAESDNASVIYEAPIPNASSTTTGLSEIWDFDAAESSSDAGPKAESDLSSVVSIIEEADPPARPVDDGSIMPMARSIGFVKEEVKKEDSPSHWCDEFYDGWELHSCADDSFSEFEE